jgi:hypothetical protein
VSPSLHLKTETDPVSETLCFLVFKIPDDGQSPDAQWFRRILILLQLRNKPQKSLRLPMSYGPQFEYHCLGVERLGLVMSTPDLHSGGLRLVSGSFQVSSACGNVSITNNNGIITRPTSWSLKLFSIIAKTRIQLSQKIFCASITDRPRSTPPETLFFCFCYSFLSEAEWTPGPRALGKFEKIHSPYRISNPRPLRYRVPYTEYTTWS